MKLILVITCIFLGCKVDCLAQKAALSANIYTGAQGFSGIGTGKSSVMTFDSVFSGSFFTQHPFGKKPGASFGIAVEYKLITKPGLFFSISAGYEILKSSIALDSVYEVGTTYKYYKATGKTRFRGNYLNLTPAIGYRFDAAGFSIDLSGGIAFARCLKTYETADANANGKGYHYKKETFHPTTDIRPTLNAMLIHKQYGYGIGYQWGIKNYYGQYIGGPQPEAYSRFLKLALSYRIK
jgi:hypothetical protein